MKRNTLLESSRISFLYALLYAVSFILLVTSLSSCGIGKRTRAMFGERLDVKVHISEKANHNSPVAVDLVLVYDEELLKRLLNMSSREWFQTREQIKRDYLQGEGLDYWTWEWVPGQDVSTQSLPLQPKAKGGLIFADYFSPGSHRFRIDPFQDIKIRLLEKGFTVEPLE